MYRIRTTHARRRRAATAYTEYGRCINLGLDNSLHMYSVTPTWQLIAHLNTQLQLSSTGVLLVNIINNIITIITFHTYMKNIFYFKCLCVKTTDQRSQLPLPVLVLL